MHLIYFLSAQPDLKSELQPVWDLIFRKIAHGAEFFVLAYLVFNAFKGIGLGIKRSLFVAFIFAIGYAGFDEWHQSFVLGRVGSIMDVGIDALGIIAFIVLQLIQKKRDTKH
jgi:VanZ family protein